MPPIVVCDRISKEFRTPRRQPGLVGGLRTLFTREYTVKRAVDSVSFGSALEFLLTFGIPLAFMAYFPAVVLLGRTSELQVNPLFAYAAPLAGLVWLFVALHVFHHEMRHYQSSGH